MDFSKILETLVPTLGIMGVARLKEELDELVEEAGEPWKKSVLALISNGVEAYGPTGIQMAVDAIEDLLEGSDKVPSWADLATGSEILAHLQNAEAGRKAATKDFLTKVGHVLGKVIGGLIKGLL